MPGLVNDRLRESHRPSLGRAHRLVALYLALLVIVASTALSLFAIRSLLQAHEAVSHTEVVIRELQRLLLAVTDAETGQRGYVITGQDSYLDPYHQAMAIVPAAVANLRRLTLDSPVQQRHLDELEPLLDARMAVLAEVIEARRTDGIERAVELVRANRGQGLMSQLRETVASMTAEEDRLLGIRSLRARELAKRSQAVVVVGIVASLPVIGFIMFLMTRETRRRQQAEVELQRLNAGLEAMVAERTAELARANIRLETLIRSAPVAIIAMDTEGRVTLWNPCAERIFGYAEDEVVGELLPIVPDDQREEWRALLRRISAGETIPTVERRRKHKTGQPVDVSVWSGPLRGHGETPQGVLAIMENVTERRLLEEQLRRSQRLDAIGKLTGGIAHDFNNLLAVIVGNLDLVLAQIEPGTPARTLAEEALDSALRGAELTQRLLAFARRQPLQPKVFDLNERLESLAPILRRTLGESIVVTIAADKDLWPTMADPAQVEDALINLAINARDAMPGGGQLTIETRNAHLDEHYAAQNAEVVPGDYVLLSVTDTGTGMPPEVLERAMEPFFTTKGVGKGTGLGLSMIYGFAKQSRGHLKIYSEVGHGTTVRLYLPRAASGAADLGKPATAAEPHPTGGETILLVEDNPQVRRSAASMLESLGYRLHVAENGPGALRLLELHPDIDLLFTDVVMPDGMTGYDLAREARRLRPQLKVLLTSGYTELSVANGRDGGTGLPVIGKPYRRHDLAHKIRSVLDAPTP